ncbi:MAG TPA: hypothetical protein VIE89_23900 [Candidatus Binatia bacterium]|jgi:uncharacterized membrane protein YeaQ/YmgE (transglycosylase-associated protein family)
MQETAQAVYHYLLGNPVVYLGVAFIAGFAGNKTVAYEAKGGFFLYLLIGLFGLFLSQFVILSFGLQEYLEKLPQFRLLFDFLAAYAGAFIIAAIIHFIKPV